MQLAGICSLFKTIPTSFVLFTLSFSVILGPIGCGGGAPGKTPRILEEPSPSTAQVTLEISSPGEGVSMAASSVHVVAHASGANPISSISVLLDGSRVLHVAGASVDARIPVAVGNHSINVQATDSKGNPAEKTVHFIVTNINISIAAPLPDTTALAPLRVLASASGTNDIVKLELRVDHTEVEQVRSSRLDAHVEVTPGPHSLTIRATDSKGNSAKRSLSFVASKPKFAVVALGATLDSSLNPFCSLINSYQLDAQTDAVSIAPISTVGADGGCPVPFAFWNDQPAGLLFGLIAKDGLWRGEMQAFAVDNQSGQITLPALTAPGMNIPHRKAAVLAKGHLLYVGGGSCEITNCHQTDVIGIGAWKVQRDGTLTAVPGMPFAVDEFPRGKPVNLSYDPTRGLLFATSGWYRSSGGTDILTYRIDTVSGALSLKSKKPLGSFEPELGPVDPSGKYLYLFTGTQNIAVELSRDGLGAVASKSPNSTPWVQGEYLHIEPSGRFAIATQRYGFFMVPEKQIFLYRIDQNTGALIRETSPIPLPGIPYGVAFDASGELVYVTNELNISVFKLDKIAGTLQELEGSPFRVGTDQQPYGGPIVIVSDTGPENDD